MRLVTIEITWKDIEIRNGGDLTKMCEIQFVSRLNKKLIDKDRKEFVKMMKKGAVSNGDAYGIFSKDYLIREGKSFKTKIKNLERDNSTLKFIDTNFLVGHNRLATTGKAKLNYNNHPFDSKKWIVVHNGVLHNSDDLKEKYNFKYKEDVDSAIIPYLLDYFEIKEKHTPIEAVKEVAELLDGSFSIMLYSKTDDCLFYFKNSSTDFYLGLVMDNDGRIILGSTSEETLEESYVDMNMIFPIRNYKQKEIVEAEEEWIYRINDKEIRKEVDFTAKTCNYYYNRGTLNDYQYEGKKSDITDWEDDYPGIDDYIDKVRDDLTMVYGINSWQTDYLKGHIWFRCESEETYEKVLETYYFAQKTKKGFKIEFGDLFDMFSNIYGITPEQRMEQKDMMLYD